MREGIRKPFAVGKLTRSSAQIAVLEERDHRPPLLRALTRHRPPRRPRPTTPAPSAPFHPGPVN